MGRRINKIFSAKGNAMPEYVVLCSFIAVLLIFSIQAIGTAVGGSFVTAGGALGASIESSAGGGSGGSSGSSSSSSGSSSGGAGTSSSGSSSSSSGSNGETCFLAGTKILLDDSRIVPIEAVKVGDKVRAYDEKLGGFKAGKVIHLIRKKSDEYLIINGKMKITPNHRVFSAGKWVAIRKLKIGDPILNRSGEAEIIKSIETMKSPGVQVYNFSVAAYHSYIAEGFVVHNAGVVTGGCDP